MDFCGIKLMLPYVYNMWDIVGWPKQNVAKKFNVVRGSWTDLSEGCQGSKAGDLQVLRHRESWKGNFYTEFLYRVTSVHRSSETMWNAWSIPRIEARERVKDEKMVLPMSSPKSGERVWGMGEHRTSHLPVHPISKSCDVLWCHVCICVCVWFCVFCRFDPAFESLSPNTREARAWDPVDSVEWDAKLSECTEHAKVGSIPTWRQNCQMLELWRALSRFRRPEASLDAWPLRLQTPRVSHISNNPILAPSPNISDLLQLPTLPKSIWSWHAGSVEQISGATPALCLCKQIDVDHNNKGALSPKTLQCSELQCISSPFPLATCWGAEGLLLWVSKQHPKPNVAKRSQTTYGDDNKNTHTQTNKQTNKRPHSFD